MERRALWQVVFQDGLGWRSFDLGVVEDVLGCMNLVLGSCLLWCSIRLYHRLQEWRSYQGRIPWLEVHSWSFQVPDETRKGSLYVHCLREVFLK